MIPFIRANYISKCDDKSTPKCTAFEGTYVMGSLFDIRHVFAQEECSGTLPRDLQESSFLEIIIRATLRNRESCTCIVLAKVCCVINSDATVIRNASLQVGVVTGKQSRSTPRKVLNGAHLTSASQSSHVELRISS
jgi:hypothetical protein